MLTRKKIQFAPRTILTHKILETMYDFPQEILRLQYLTFGDGIVSGLEFKEVNREIFLTEGIVKFKGEFYFSSAGEVNLTKFFKENKPPMRGAISCFALCPSQNSKIDGGVKTEFLELKILLKKDLPPDVLCLGSFYDELSDIALPDKDISAEKFWKEFTTFNRLQLLDVPYSCSGGSTFHPYIFCAMKNILKRKENKSPTELTLLLQIYQTGFITMEALKTCIESDDTKKFTPSAAREEIFESLTQWLKLIHTKVISSEEKTIIKETRPSARQSLKI